MDDIPKQIPDSPTRLIDQIRAKIRSRNLTYATERTYVHWILRFIRFNGKRHPMNMGGGQILFRENWIFWIWVLNSYEVERRLGIRIEYRGQGRPAKVDRTAI